MGFPGLGRGKSQEYSPEVGACLMLHKDQKKSLRRRGKPLWTEGQRGVHAEEQEKKKTACGGSPNPQKLIKMIGMCFQHRKKELKVFNFSGFGAGD